MITLTKLAGYENDDLEEKVAEAMDYMESYGIDAIGGLTLLANTDGNLNIVDEKVAAIAEAELTEEQADVLAKVAEYLGGVDEEVATVALDIADNANFLVEKVAAYAAEVEEAGMPFEDTMVLANASTEYGIDEKVANEAIAAGYTDEHLEFSERVAQEIYDDLGILPEEALTIYKEAATLWDGVKGVGKGVYKAFTTDHRDAGEAIKKGLKSYKETLTGKNVRRAESASNAAARKKEAVNKGLARNKKKYKKALEELKKNKKAGKIGNWFYNHKEKKLKNDFINKQKEIGQYAKGTNELVRNREDKIKTERLKTLGARGATGAALGYAGYKGYQATKN
jgi:hypothetical protein